MEPSFWIDLIRRLPAPLHDALSFSLVSGGEIVSQSILRLENDFVVLRGRVAGTQDQGRVIVLPFTHIIHLGFNKRLTDPEVEAIFGGPPPAALEMPQVSKAPLENLPEETGEVIQDEFEDRVAPSAPAKPGGVSPGPLPVPGKTAPISKTVLLARLRERLAEQDNSPS